MNEQLRRLKCFYLSEDRVLNLFRLGQFVPGECLSFTHPLPLPEGTRTLAVHHDYMRRAFCFTVEHESFDEVPEACSPPEIGVTLQTICLPIPVTEQL